MNVLCGSGMNLKSLDFCQLISREPLRSETTRQKQLRSLLLNLKEREREQTKIIISQ